MTTAEQLANDLENLHSRTLAAHRAAAELRRLAAENESAHIVGIRQEREIMALEAENERLRADAERYLECLRWVQGHIIRYDPPGLPNHLALKIIAAMKEQP